MALGQFHEAVRYDLQGLEIGVDPVWETVVLAVMQDDVPELRRILPSIPPAVFNNRGPGPRIFPLMRAGLFDQAREVLKAAAATGLNGEGLLAFARGDLSLSDGRADEAIPLLTQAVTGLKSKRFEYYLACESLATALKRASRPAEALAALEVCGSERRGTTRSTSTGRRAGCPCGCGSPTSTGLSIEYRKPRRSRASFANYSRTLIQTTACYNA